MRLNKFLAHCGIASRRMCDELIFNGKVIVNSKVVDSPWCEVDLEKDIILVNGKHLKLENKIYIAINKPKDVICTLRDDFKRVRIVDLVPMKERLYPVGRLDYDTTGIILLTNDGDIANRLIHPRYKVEKVYKATLNNILERKDILKLERGVILDDGVHTQPAKCKLLKVLSNGCSIAELVIKEGMKRQVKRMFAAIGYKVIELERVQFAFITSQGLKRGEWRYLTSSEVKMLFKIAGMDQKVASN